MYVGWYLCRCHVRGFFNCAGVMYVAMEYAKHGDLRSFLRKSRKLRQHEYGNCGSTPFLSKTMLLRFALDTAQGLRHLADRQVTHSLSLSVCLSVCLSVSLSLCISLSVIKIDWLRS